MTEHDEIVKNLKEQLQIKGINPHAHYSRREVIIAEIGHHPSKPKVAHIGFKPDIVMSGNNKPEDRFFLEYVHTKERYVHDLRGMITLSSLIKKARAFVLIVNDKIYEPFKGVIGNVESLSLSTFQRRLKKLSKDEFLRYLEG